MLAACGNTEKPSADTQGNEQANASTSTDTANTTDAANTGNSSSSTKITDLAGRSVSLQQPLKAALALAGPSYEKVFLLGQADKLIGGHAFIIDRPWVKETNPDISKLTPISNPAEPNIEALSALNPDAIFFWDYKEPLASMEAAKLPVVVVQQSSGNPKTATEFIAYQKREVDVFANAFGSEALSKAKTWSSYFDEKVKYVSERVSSINDDQRKRVIFAYDESGLGVFSTYSYPSFWIELAGGKNIADETGAEMDTEITMEQMAAWNPDIVFMSRADSTEQVTASEAWAEISAVKNAQVFLCPDGVMYWDYSSEGVLLMQYLAQKMYPELFTDLDMVAELKDYYQRFYGYTLSDANAQRILDHLPPA
jgi:iron complex transport system substrate-binding protein